MTNTAQQGNHLDQLIALVGEYQGSGTNHEGESFIGRLTLKSAGSGNGIALSFTATSESGEVFHEETSIVAHDPSGVLTYYPISNNIPVVMPHTLDETTTDKTIIRFRLGDQNDRAEFRETIELRHSDESVEMKYSWGMPGEDFDERSRVLMSPATG